MNHRSERRRAGGTSPAPPRRGDRCGRAGGLKSGLGTAPAGSGCTGSLATDPRGIRTRIPALPFCNATLTARKPEHLVYPRDPKTWGEHLRRQRIVGGLRQKDLAVAHGLNLTSIQNWETGRTEPEIRFLPKIIAFLGYCPYTPGRPLGERLRVAREAQGLSRKRLAATVQVDEVTLWKWEQGIRTPKGRLAVVADAILGAVAIAAARDRGRIGRPCSGDEIREIRRLRAEGLTLREIGRRVGVAANTVRQHSHGK
jgi:transcriptional regulator with XRE-family HTH domain